MSRMASGEKILEELEWEARINESPYWSGLESDDELPERLGQVAQARSERVGGFVLRFGGLIDPILFASDRGAKVAIVRTSNRQMLPAIAMPDGTLAAEGHAASWVALLGEERRALSYRDVKSRMNGADVPVTAVRLDNVFRRGGSEHTRAPEMPRGNEELPVVLSAPIGRNALPPREWLRYSIRSLYELGHDLDKLMIAANDQTLNPRLAQLLELARRRQIGQ